MLTTLLIALAAFALFPFVLGVVSMTKQVSITGPFSASSSVTVTDNEKIVANPTVIAAQPGTLTTRSSNTAGTLTMTNSGHGITTGQRVDLYWSGGACYGATVGTVSGTSVPIASVNGGDDLPAATTAITVGIATEVPFSFTGNNIQGVVATIATAGVDAYFVWNNGSSDVYEVLMTGPDVFSWITGDLASNPFGSMTPTVLYMSHNDTTKAHTDLQAGCVTH